MKALKADDKKLTKWIKNLCKTRNLPEEVDPEAPRQYKLEDSIGIDRCEISLVPFVECLIKPGEASQTLEFATELRSAGYPLSAESFVQGCLNELALAKLGQIIPYIGNFGVLEKWRKVTKKPAPAFSDELRALLAESPSMVALEWLLQKAKPDTLQNEYRWLLAEIDCSNPPAADLLAGHLSKDPKGVRLGAVLACSSPENVPALGKLIAESKVCLATFVEASTCLGSKPKGQYPLSELTESVFGNMHELSKPPVRQYSTAALVKLIASLLMEKKLNESGQQALSTARYLSKQIGRHQVQEGLGGDTWIVQTYLEQHEDESDGFTLKGARQWALTYEDARLNGHDLTGLTMLAKNCGLSAFETPAESVTFDSAKHLDVKGGLLPGDQAVIVDPGWTFEDTILIRANAKGACDKEG